MMAWVLTFLALLVTDIAWAIYINKAKDQPFAASSWAVVLYGLSAYGTMGFTKDAWLLIPAMAGAFAGTYIGVWWNKRP